MKNNAPKPSQGSNHIQETKTSLAPDIEIGPEFIKTTRKALGLTVEHFAWLLGVSPSSVFRYESTGVPTIHHGSLTRKLHLLGFWLKEPESSEIMAQLLMVKDGLPALSGLLEMGGALIAQESAEIKATGGNNRGAAGKAPQSKNSSGKSDPAKAPENGRKGGLEAPPAEAAPLLPAGTEASRPLKSDLKLPPLINLAKRGFRAFNLAAGVLDQNGQGVPLLNNQEAMAKPMMMESQAKELEAEAMLIEAQARKLEAEARKFEAEQRMAKAKKSLES